MSARNVVRATDADRDDVAEPGYMNVVVRSAVALAVVVTVLACWVGRCDFLMLVGGEVLRPTDVSLAVWSFGVLASLGLIAVTLVRHRLHPPAGTSLRLAVGATLAVTLVGTGAWCVGQAVVVGGVAAFGADSYSVLRAPANEGCALIVHENGALRTSSGEVYAVDLLGFARSVGSWTADEIELPVRDGTYSLRWSGGVGDLALHGDHAETPNRFQLLCDQ